MSAYSLHSARAHVRALQQVGVDPIYGHGICWPREGPRHPPCADRTTPELAEDVTVHARVRKAAGPGLGGVTEERWAGLATGEDAQGGGPGYGVPTVADVEFLVDVLDV